jgi:hypothetical protein
LFANQACEDTFPTCVPMLVVIQEHEKLGFFIFLKIASIPSHRSSSEDVFHLSKESKHFDIL